MSSRQRFCFALDLRDEPTLIARYKEYHKLGNAWPEITESIKNAGIEDMEIYCTGNRLFMIIEVNESFDIARKAKSDQRNLKVQEWEALMGQFQLPLPWAAEGEKWVSMEEIYKLP